MHQKRTISSLIGPIIIIIVLFSIIYIIGHSIILKNHDIKLWKEFRNNLNSDEILKVEFFGTKSLTLRDKDKNAFIDTLKKSTFYKSNRERNGSTGVVIVLHYTNGSEFSFSCQGGNHFELSYKDLQFLIKNKEITKLMDENGINWYDT